MQNADGAGCQRGTGTENDSNKVQLEVDLLLKHDMNGGFIII
jgi:hypothetical protein